MDDRRIGSTLLQSVQRALDQLNKLPVIWRVVSANATGSVKLTNQLHLEPQLRKSRAQNMLLIH